MWQRSRLPDSVFSGQVTGSKRLPSNQVITLDAAIILKYQPIAVTAAYAESITSEVNCTRNSISSLELRDAAINGMLADQMTTSIQTITLLVFHSHTGCKANFTAYI